MNPLQEKYPQEIETILNKYPAESHRAAVMPPPTLDQGLWELLGLAAHTFSDPPDSRVSGSRLLVRLLDVMRKSRYSGD